MKLSESAVLFITVMSVVAAGLGIGYMISSSISQAHSSSGSNNVYDLNLLEVMDANYNSSAGAQPRFYVVQESQLQSAVNITLPAFTAIHVTITAYDMGNASVASQYLNVTGTIGNSVTLVNGMVASGSNTSLQWEKNVSSVPASEVLHTFTILNGATTLVNIPVVAGDTEIATFYLNETGNFNWQCEAACGTGPSGWSGPMSMPGWMQGTVFVAT